MLLPGGNKPVLPIVIRQPGAGETPIYAPSPPAAQAPSPPAAQSPSPPAANPYATETALTPAQISQIESIFTQTVDSLGANFSAGTLENALALKLQALGWTPGMILAAQEGSSEWEPHGPSFGEENAGGQFGANEAPVWAQDVASFVNQILAGNGAQATSSAPSAPAAPAAPTNPTNTTGGTTLPLTGGDSGLGSALLSGAGSSGVPGAGSIDSAIPSVTTPGVTTTGGNVEVGVIAILAVIGIIVYFVWRSHKNKTTKKDEKE